MTILQKAKEVSSQANKGNIEPLKTMCNYLFNKLDKSWGDVEGLFMLAGIKDLDLVYKIWYN